MKIVFAILALGILASAIAFGAGDTSAALSEDSSMAALFEEAILLVSGAGLIAICRMVGRRR